MAHACEKNKDRYIDVLIKCIKSPSILREREDDIGLPIPGICVSDGIEYIDFDPFEDEEDELFIFNIYEFYNSEFYKKALRDYRKSNPVYIAMSRLRSGINSIIKRRGLVKEKRTSEILGCTESEFIKHIESKFEDWMNWSNHSCGNKICKNDFLKSWDIDHIIPISTAKNIEDIYRLNHYTNLQPMCSAKNRYYKKNNLN